MLTVDVQAIHDGQMYLAHYEGEKAFDHAIDQAREWEENGYQKVKINSSRPMNMLEFAINFGIVYTDENGEPHHERWADHLEFVKRQDADRVWSVVPRQDGRGTELAFGFYPSNERYVVTEKPWIDGINTVNHSSVPSSSFQQQDDDVLALKSTNTLNQSQRM